MTLKASRSIRSLVVVRPFRNRNGARLWRAECRAPRCTFEHTASTHNGAHLAAAAHRREKALTKLHGAKETTTL